MQDWTKSFIVALSGKPHINELLKNIDLCLEVEVDNDAFYIHFQYDGIEFSETSPFQAISYARLSGTRECLLLLFNGDVKLRECTRSGNLKVSGTFRIMLLLESIFCLARPITA